MVHSTCTLRRQSIARQLGIKLPERLIGDVSPWHTVVSSRLGRNLISHRAEIAMQRRFIEQAAARGDRIVIVRDTAAHPWSARACELLGIEPIKLCIDEATDSWQRIEFCPTWCRDKLAIELADRVDATFVRPKGTIMRLLCQRLEHEQTPTVQVLVTKANQQTAKELIARGAIGFWCNREPQPELPNSADIQSPQNDAQAINSLLNHPDRWLIHSTRQRTGPWPGQSLSQFNDWLLLSAPATAAASPLETLDRIVREKRLVGSHRTTAADTPVVCFTALKLTDWLSRRQFRSHLGRWDAEPYGVAISRTAAQRFDIQPAIYGDKVKLAELSTVDRWRYQATGKTYDWTTEQEWRNRGVLNLAEFAADEVIVFVKCIHEIKLLAHSRWPIVAIEMLSSALPKVGTQFA